MNNRWVMLLLMVSAGSLVLAEDLFAQSEYYGPISGGDMGKVKELIAQKVPMGPGKTWQGTTVFLE